MADNVDMRVLELLSSRLCHDLVGPVGAVNNGLELVEEDPSSLNEIMPLLTSSARQAWRRLDFFRVAFGFGGGRGSWSYSELRRLTTGMLEQSKADLDWQLDAEQDGSEAEGRRGKLLLNMIVLAMESLPRGGTVSVSLATSPGWRLVVTASGTGASLHERAAAAIAGQVPLDDLEARTAQPYFTRLLAEQMHGSIRCDVETDQRIFIAETP